MTRIRFRRGTEAQILAVTNAADGEPFYSTDTEKFFIGDETGVPQPLGGGGGRGTAEYTTATLAAGAESSTGTVTLPATAALLKIETNYPARVRLYLSSAYRTADLSRLVTLDPEGDHGCVLEEVTTGSVLALHLSPVAMWAGVNSGTTGYLAVQNLDTVSRAITATFTLLSLEG